MGRKHRRQRPATVPIGPSKQYVRRRAARALGPRVGASAAAFQTCLEAKRAAGVQKLGSKQVGRPCAHEGAAQGIETLKGILVGDGNQLKCAGASSLFSPPITPGCPAC